MAGRILNPFVFIVILISLIAAKAQEPKDKVTRLQQMKQMEAEVKKWAQNQNGKTYQVNLNDHNTNEGLRVRCPFGLLCPSQEYSLFYEANMDGKEFTYIRLFFNTNNFDDLTTKKFQDTFSYAYFDIDLSHHFKNSTFLVSLTDSLVRRDNPGWSITHYEDNHLKGKVKYTEKYIHIQRTDEWAQQNCTIEDAEPPPGCLGSVKVNIPFEFSFDLRADTMPKDCRDAKFPEDEQCG